MKILALVAALSGLLFSNAALAFPMPNAKKDALAMNLQVFTGNYDFEGIVSLNNCSGSLIRFENSRDTDLAVVMTNGHCNENGFLSPGEIMVNRPSSRSFGLMKSNGSVTTYLRATTIIYSTMTKTDITLYRLGQTYAQILASTGVRPLTLSSRHPELHQPIEVISGYWHRGYSCSINSFVFHLKEADWIDEDSIRYSDEGCDTIGGTSGSPIVATGTRTVIGINNTGNENGEQCTENNPCEIDENGKVTYQQGWSYGQQTYWIYSCLNSNNELDLNQTGCELPK